MKSSNDNDKEKDIWYRWLQGRRDGGDRKQREETLRRLAHVRDKVIENAELKEEETLLDVGCGDGLIGLGALDAVPTCKVIFSDISSDLLDYCRDVVTDAGELERCRFEKLSADNLDTIANASIDAVTTRSVLIYVSAKKTAFQQFYRVLKPGGRLSIFEPINRFGYTGRRTDYLGYDLTPVIELYEKVRTAFGGNSSESTNQEQQKSQPGPMVDFDERDLIAITEEVGFKEIVLDYQAVIHPYAPIKWELLYRTAPNPNVPTLEEAVQQTLTSQEAEAFIDYMKPLVERGEGTRKIALAYLHAVK